MTNTKVTAKSLTAGMIVSSKYIPVGNHTVKSVRITDGVNHKTAWLVLVDADGNEVPRKIGDCTYPEWGFSLNTKFEVK